MRLLNKTSWKFLWIFMAIVAASLAVAYTTVFFSSEAQEQRASEKYIND